MPENLTTRYFREQMRHWSVAQLVDALDDGLPWHEHTAARELLAARRDFDASLAQIQSSATAPIHRLPAIARAALVLPFLAAAVFLAFRAGHPPGLHTGGASVAPKDPKPLLKLAFRVWRVAR